MSKTASMMTDTPPAQIEKQAKTAAERLAKAKTAIGEVVYGQDHVVDLTLAALLSGGHTLLVGVPGLAKTLLVETLGTVMGLDNKRVQFTPDLMPADIVGSEVLEEGDDLPAPFHVLATQNPIEQEGTYPLPEAQLDRFLLQVNVEFPDLDTERMILLATTGASEAKAKKVITPKQLQDMQMLIRKLPIGESVVNAILSLTRNARPDQSEYEFIRKHVSWGPGPRAGQALMLATRAKALIEGRISPSVDDVIALAGPVLQHRMAISFAARAEGETIDGIIAQLKAKL